MPDPEQSAVPHPRPWRVILEAGLIHSCIWVGFCATGLLTLMHGIVPVFAWQPYLLCFTGVVFIYNLDHLLDARAGTVSDPELATLLDGRFRLMILALMSVCAAIALGLLARYPTLRTSPALYLAAGAGLFYGLPILPTWSGARRGWRRLKDLPGMKVVLIASAVTTAALALPISFASIDPLQRFGEVAPAALFLFVFTGTNALLFDLHDITADRASGARTLPVTLGPDRTRQLLTWVNLLAGCLLIVIWLSGPATPYPEWLLLLAGMIGLTYRLGPNTPRSLVAWIVDGTLLLPGCFGLLRDALQA